MSGPVDRETLVRVTFLGVTLYLERRLSGYSDYYARLRAVRPRSESGASWHDGEVARVERVIGILRQLLTQFTPKVAAQVAAEVAERMWGGDEGGSV